MHVDIITNRLYLRERLKLEVDPGVSYEEVCTTYLCRFHTQKNMLGHGFSLIVIVGFNGFQLHRRGVGDYEHTAIIMYLYVHVRTYTYVFIEPS